MKLAQPKGSTLAGIGLGAACLISAIWVFWPQAYSTVHRAERLTIYEGLPHPGYEAEALQAELKAKDVMRLSGFPFYREPLDLKDEDVAALRVLLGARTTYLPHEGEKTCGGFHPDYAVEWTSGGDVYRCLICFGCSEARIEAPGGTWFRYDLRSEGHGRDRTMELLDLLKPYRKNRPPHERFGIGPLAV